MRSSICLFCAGALLLLCSCKNETKELRRRMEEFMVSTVVIPDGIEQINYSKREAVDYGDKEARLVVYVDSIACAECKIKSLFIYEGITGFGADSLSEYVPVFIFSPRKYQYRDLKSVLQVSGLDYPALLDENGLFQAANPHIPADSRFHTFLIDRNGKVVLVGDPVNNPGLWELYKTTITRLIENGGTMPSAEQ